MLVQYLAKFVKSICPESPIAVKLNNLAIPVSDFRILLRYYGLLPMIQWIITSELNPNKNKIIRWLNRFQNIANIIYYPLGSIHIDLYLTLFNIL